MYGKEIYAEFEQWRVDFGFNKYEVKGCGELIKRLKNNLKLPFDAIVSLPKNRDGIQQRYDLKILNKFFGIGVCLIPQEDALGEEVKLITIDKKSYYTDNDQFIYEIEEDESIGNQVGSFKNGNAVWY